MMPFRRAAAKLLRKIHDCPRVGSVFLFSENPTTSSSSIVAGGRRNCSFEDGFGNCGRRGENMDTFRWILICGPAAIAAVLGMNISPAFADDSSVDVSPENTSGSEIPVLRKIEDGSVVSNIHTSKWRVFTDTGRDFFSKQKLVEAEKFFVAALQEAKEGFGERDPHVASACNNLAELYRVIKDFDKAEPLYLEAINILEESFGSDDIRVGAALHNLGQFYRVCGRLDQARVCYERAVKIKRRVLGQANPDYADTLYHLGTVLYLEGKEKDAEVLIWESIQSLEEGGLGESNLCLRRLQFLAQIFMKSNKLVEAEKIQRKILHVMELSKGWNSLHTVLLAERLALNLTSIGNLEEADELLERCLDARKILLPEDDIEVAANMLYIARVKKLKANQLRKKNVSQAVEEYKKAKLLLSNSIRVARKVLDQVGKQRQKQKPNGLLRNMHRKEHSALLILLQSLGALAVLEEIMIELQNSSGNNNSLPEVEKNLCECISAFKEFGAKTVLSNSAEVKTEYLSCLKHLYTLLIDDPLREKDALGELKDEINQVEAEIFAKRKAQ
ncbi:OLC1v1010250C1 [Oldenlandia corymbosa var. corymbosa]|uniref:OLC1v1010250C1 n=1 Tax=Oldenlandia corymbosa var. corymbosa TaxID=529605 RepID=A0AAV1DQX8_OLDCO|nr:OLC1v1010250C1 [Oldenlandia corymbosa var. corymbosa]